MHVTLVVATLNEIEGMKLIMPKIDRKWVDHIVVLDGGSTDGTLEYAREQGYEVYIQKKKGLINGYRELYSLLKTDAVITFSPDGNSVAEVVKDVSDKMREGYDMVIASRYLGNAKSDDDNIITAFGNWIFTKTIGLCFGFGYTDAMVIFRGYTLKAFSDLQLMTDHRFSLETWAKNQTGLGIEPLLSMRAAKAGLNICEVPGDEPSRVGGVKKARHFVYGLLYLFEIVQELIFWRIRKVKANAANT